MSNAWILLLLPLFLLSCYTAATIIIDLVELLVLLSSYLYNKKPFKFLVLRAFFLLPLQFMVALFINLM